MSAAGADNDANSNNIVFTIKGTQLFVPVVTLSVRDNQNYQNFLVKDLKDKFIIMNTKQKMRIKIQHINKIFFRIKFCWS